MHELWTLDTFVEVAQVVVVWRKVLEPVEQEVQEGAKREIG